MSEEYVSEEEFQRERRFHAEQFKEVGLQLIELRKKMQDLSPATPMAPVTRDLLSRQVEKMFKDIEFLKKEILRLQKPPGVK